MVWRAVAGVFSEGPHNAWSVARARSACRGGTSQYHDVWTATPAGRFGATVPGAAASPGLFSRPCALPDTFPANQGSGPRIAMSASQDVTTMA